MATHGQLPARTNTVSTGYGSDDEAAGDPSSTLGLLEERLQAWKHMTGYLEDYVKAVAKDQHQQAKDSEKILKTLNNPLKEGHHFDQSLGGIAGLFENLRANTNAQAQLYAETEKNLDANVLPILDRLHKEIKAKRKELDHGAGKQAKAIESARNSSQKHVELLGQHTATFDSMGGKTTAANDPYVLQRGVWYRMNKQLMEENAHRSDLIAIQNNFQQFEAHVIQTVQNALGTYNQFMAGAHDRAKAMYGDIAGTAANIRPDFEWNGFVQRNGHVLISPNAPARSIDSVSFPNQDHRATKALIEGSLERKSRGIGALGGYKSAYYAVTPAGYLHEYKDNDNFHHEPSPETSLFLPDCVIGAVAGQKFAIKGKDTSGSKLSQKMSMSSEYQFKAHTSQDALQWHNVIASVCSGESRSLMNSPTSPTSMQDQIPHNMSSTAAPAQTTGITGMPATSHPQHAGTAVPASATATSPTATTSSPMVAQAAPMPTHHQPAPTATGTAVPSTQYQAAPTATGQLTTSLAPLPGQRTGVTRSGSFHTGPKITKLGPRQY